jgi:hypothetical protein
MLDDSVHRIDSSAKIHIGWIEAHKNHIVWIEAHKNLVTPARNFILVESKHIKILWNLAVDKRHTMSCLFYSPNIKQIWTVQLMELTKEKLTDACKSSVNNVQDELNRLSFWEWGLVIPITFSMIWVDLVNGWNYNFHPLKLHFQPFIKKIK